MKRLILFSVSLLLLSSCGKLPETVKGSINNTTNLLDKLQTVAANGNRVFTIEFSTMTNTYTATFMPKQNKPFVWLDKVKFAVWEADNSKKEIIESDIEYNEEGKVIHSYNRHEIPAKEKTAISTISDKLIGQTPFFLLFIIALICVGAIIYGKYFYNKKDK